MKRLLTTLVILTGLVGSAGAVWADAQSDFENGMKAAQSGDFATALKEWKPLAEHGSRKAQFYLGGMYEKGKGVSQDTIAAYMWFNIAAEQGHKKAASNWDIAKSKLS